MVGHSCNPSYSGGGPMLPRQKLKTLSETRKKKIKKDWGVTQMVEHFPASMRPVLSNDEESFKIFKELLL
jgi:hypothetical protein